MILPIGEAKVCVFWHVNIVPDIWSSLSIFEGINFSIEFAKECMLIKEGGVASLNLSGSYRNTDE